MGRLGICISEEKTRGLKPPCGKDCSERRIGCHSACSKWEEYSEEKRKRHEEYSKKEYVVYAYVGEKVVSEKELKRKKDQFSKKRLSRLGD